MLMDITGNYLDLSDQHVGMVCDVHGCVMGMVCDAHGYHEY